MGKVIQNNTVRNSSWGLGSVLTVIFVCCKLFGVIDWSWWWVFSPLWIGWCIVLLIGLVFILISVIAEYT